MVLLCNRNHCYHISLFCSYYFCIIFLPETRYKINNNLNAGIEAGLDWRQLLVDIMCLLLLLLILYIKQL
jgi:hypothetical protein